MVVEENCHLLSVVSLDRARAPVFGGHARPDGEGLRPAHARGAPTVVVAIATRTFVILTKVGQKERAPAPGVLGVPTHHLQARGLNLLIASCPLGRCLEGGGEAHLLVPPGSAVGNPACRADIN